MTGPRPAEPVWWTRPSLVLPAVFGVALLVAVLTPQPTTGRLGDQRLSSHLAGSLGARLFADMAGRMGWRVEQRDTVPVPIGRSGRTVHAVLAPRNPLTADEAHAYLSAVRGGDALLLVLEGRTRLSDSLHVAPMQGGYLRAYGVAETECTTRDRTPPLWPDDRVHLYGVRWLRGMPAERVDFGVLLPDNPGRRRGVIDSGDPLRRSAAAVGFPYGNGRIIVVADPDMLRNDVLRNCAWGTDLLAVQMLEWLRAGGAEPRTVLAFDEYHQGFGGRSGMLGVAGEFLVGHPMGRFVVALTLAGVVLLLSAAPRPVRPRDVERIERRDPLEHVDALAHAYEAVRASQTLTARLLRGLRWRLERGAMSRASADDIFLDRALVRAPELASEVALVRRALHTSVHEREIPDVGAAIRRIEDTLTTTVS